MNHAKFVGRGEKSEARLGDPSVSRVHFQIGNDGETVVIADQGSSSGTFVDGTKVDNAQIKIGAVVQAGDTRMRLEHDALTERTMAPTSQPETGESKPLPQLIGTELGPYMLNEIIGKGSSGMVFKAYDAEKDRTAAVKVLTPQFTANDEQRQRFVRAMKTMLPVKDARIVNLFNAGKNGPYRWAAMEYIEGENLSQLIERTGIEGMIEWHLGDIPYLAPERTMADATVDTRSDLYGLGATCYALLTGRPPVSGDSLTELVQNVRDEQPKPPKKYQLAVNELFQDVVMAMIAKDPADRYQTPSDLIKEFAKIGKFNNLDLGF